MKQIVYTNREGGRERGVDLLWALKPPVGKALSQKNKIREMMMDIYRRFSLQSALFFSFLVLFSFFIKSEKM